jgi:hypothetical protein
MSTRKALLMHRAEFVAEVIDAPLNRSRAQELVESGLLDRAAQITELARDLTDAAVREMESELLERRRNLAEVRSLRGAAFKGIAYCVIDRLDKGERR